MRRPGRPLTPPDPSKFRDEHEQTYQLKRRVFELLGDVNRAEVASRLPCSPTSLSHYVTSAKWWPREVFDRLIAIVVELRGTVDDELLGHLEEAFSAAEQAATPTAYEIGRLQAEIQRYVQQVADLRRERDSLRQQSTGASGDEQVALQQRISELEEELRKERQNIGRLRRQLAELQRRLAASQDPSAVLEAARYAADEVARIADPTERRERALDAVSDLNLPDAAAEFIGHLRVLRHNDDAKSVLEDIVLSWSAARIAEYVAALNEPVGADPVAGGTSDTDGPGMRALLSATYRQNTEFGLRMAALQLLDAEAFAGVVHVLHAQGATELMESLLTERAAQRTVEGMQLDADALQERTAQSYLFRVFQRPPQEIADLVVALRRADQDQQASWLLDTAGALLQDADYLQLETLLLAAGRIHDRRTLLRGRESMDRN
ncbi:hypothetical protein [Streptomyces caniscabiei]|uniref:hypothetical protein n=1 Tax=Streptomyces caniscabiei TaxID=2746961 RepID=UPI000A3C81D0|nr:hypothetical protein [Streptomyces caniscabiei]